jgi:hypothetical protein
VLVIDGQVQDKARQSRRCWLTQKRAKKRSCIERLQGRAIADILLLKRTPMALEMNGCDLPNSDSRGHVQSTSGHS